jgi:hypothetical protein
MIDSKYLSLYQIMAKEGHFGGGPRPEEWKWAKQLFNATNCKTFLDFGCGRGKQWRPRLVPIWGELKPTLYDPAFEDHSTLPKENHDMIMSTDVLEHIPEYTLPEVIKYCNSHANNANFHFIANKPAQKNLPNGENAHCSVFPVEWWVEMFKKHSVKEIPTLLVFTDHDIQNGGRLKIKLWY